MKETNELMVGIAAEHLVCAFLIRSGIQAFRAVQSCPFDVAAQLDGVLIRLQVKATRDTRQLQQMKQQHVTGYVWNLRRGKGADRAYGDDEIDGVAAVALDSRNIAWLLQDDVRQTFIIPTEGHKTRCKEFGDFTLERFVRRVGP